MRYKFLISSFSDHYEYNCLSVHSESTDNCLGSVSTNNSKGSVYEKNDNLVKLDPISKYVDNIIGQRYLNKDTGIVPPGLLAVTGKYIVFERPPEYKNIFIIPRTVSEIQDNDEAHVYRIPIPWTLYFVQYTTVIDEVTKETNYYASNVRMHFMQTNLRSHDQLVYLPPIPNFYTNSNLCRPMFSSMEDTERYTKDIAGCIHTAYDWIWNCGTNLDLTEPCVQMFSQFKDEDVSNTVFKSMYERIPYKLSNQVYYAHMNHIDAIMNCWQKISLEEVCDLKWPANSLFGTFNSLSGSYTNTDIENYLDYIGQSVVYEYHYDEDSDEPYQCDYDECECRNITNLYDRNEFLSWMGIWPPKPVSYINSFSNFIESFESEFINYSPLHVRSLINNSMHFVDYV